MSSEVQASCCTCVQHLVPSAVMQLGALSSSSVQGDVLLMSAACVGRLMISCASLRLWARMRTTVAR